MQVVWARQTLLQNGWAKDVQAQIGGTGRIAAVRRRQGARVVSFPAGFGPTFWRLTIWARWAGKSRRCHARHLGFCARRSCRV